MLLERPEDQWFDRKSSRIAARDVADALVGFANAEGGLIAIGLHGGRIQGVDAAPVHTKNAWRQAAIDFTVPPVRASFHEAPCRNERGHADHLLLVEVDPSRSVHANRRDEVYLRIGDENRRLTYQQRQELNYEKGQASFEATPTADCSMEELDSVLVNRYAALVGHPHTERLLIARGLATPDMQLTVGCVLLFGAAPQARFPEAFVRVLRYRGTERGTGARQQLVEDVRCEGPIPTVIEGSRAAVERLLPTRRALTASGRFEGLPLLPRDAWLEGIVNAVIHRSYSVSGDHIRVELFDDRVEIESPGRFPGLADLSDPISIPRFARNPRIARVCADLGLGQELGEGIRRIFDEMRLAGLTKPLYSQTAGTARLVLLADQAEQGVEAELPAATLALLRHLRSHGPSSTGVLVKEAGLSRPTLLRRLRSLESVGLIEWVGQSKNDPRAWWQAR
ncbi:MAG: putative DNA binding domain-containing protein [Deltaproteobacteria bacterium]|nr:putative DNA binding domain-containing protein [Deltaproteobacteria bacterium]